MLPAVFHGGCGMAQHTARMPGLCVQLMVWHRVCGMNEERLAQCAPRGKMAAKAAENRLDLVAYHQKLTEGGAAMAAT